MVESLFSRVREEAFCIPQQEIDDVIEFPFRRKSSPEVLTNSLLIGVVVV